MFVIDENNSIMPGLARVGSSSFHNLPSLTEIAEERKWTKQTVTDVWNGFAGTAGQFRDLKPMKCFKNRPYGLRKIWEAIQRLVPSDAASEPVAPVNDTVDDMPKKKSKAKKAMKQTKAKKEAKEPRAKGNSKKDQAAAMLLRKSGATSAELQERLGWNETSVTMFIQWVSLIVRTGIKTIETEKKANGERVYKAAA